MRALRIPEAEGFFAIEVNSSFGDTDVVASTKTQVEVQQFQDFLKANGRGHEQLISLSDRYAVTENFNGPILWTKDEAPCLPSFNGLEVKAELRSYEDLVQVFGHTEDWKAIEAVNSINSKLEAFSLSFDEYCEAAEAAKAPLKVRRHI